MTGNTGPVLIPYRHASKVKSYADAAEAAGLRPEAVLTDRSIPLDRYRGVILMGGTDVNPALYGEEPHPETDKKLDDDRDQVELAVIAEAIERDLPVLAICRGHQLLNVFHGGTLIQHLPTAPDHDTDFEDKAAVAHEVDIEPGTLLAETMGAPRVVVNSRHHQAVNKVGAGLRVTAWDTKDGVIEAMERPDRRFILAVQWHPEDQVGKYPEQLRLFTRFAQAL
jgi:gamma-glutamyl-gamma-aminobutyrate hydrolase PuuD